jgi:hypothetical protein
MRHVARLIFVECWKVCKGARDDRFDNELQGSICVSSKVCQRLWNKHALVLLFNNGKLSAVLAGNGRISGEIPESLVLDKDRGSWA